MDQRHPALRLVVNRDGRSTGYKSGRKRWRETPVTDSIGSTHSAGTLLRAIQVETVLCAPTLSKRAKAVCPPTASHASNMAALRSLVDMGAINAQTDSRVNAEIDTSAHQNAPMGKRAEMPASDFWIRLSGSLPESWRPINPNSLATRLHMSQGSVHRWYMGTGLPELKTALQLAKASGVCVDWLLNGVKPRYPISKDPILRELFDLCEDLDEEGRKHVLRAARGELSQQKERMDERQERAHIGAINR